MIIRMEHPKHGRMHVYDMQEKQRAEVNGWTEVQKPSGIVIKEEKRKPGRPRKKD